MEGVSVNQELTQIRAKIAAEARKDGQVRVAQIIVCVGRQNLRNRL